MIYYIDTIEQVEAAPDSEWNVNEYGSRTKYAESQDSEGNLRPITFYEVESKYFKKLSDVSNDLKAIDPNKKHYYMNIKICDTTGGVLEQKTIGEMQDVHKKEVVPETED